MQHSFSVAPPSKAELAAMRAVGRCERGFDYLAHDAARLGFLNASLAARLDADASLGLAILEAEMLLGLAREPAQDIGQFRIKAAIFRSWLDACEDDTNLGAILCAALSADAGRLGLAIDGAGWRQ